MSWISKLKISTFRINEFVKSYWKSTLTTLRSISSTKPISLKKCDITSLKMPGEQNQWLNLDRRAPWLTVLRSFIGARWTSSMRRATVLRRIFTSTWGLSPIRISGLRLPRPSQSRKDLTQVRIQIEGLERPMRLMWQTWKKISR